MDKVFNGHALGLVMARRKLSIWDLASKVEHRNQQKIRKYISRKSMPSHEEVKEMAKILQWPLEFFYLPDIEWEEKRWVSGYIIKTPLL